MTNHGDRIAFACEIGGQRDICLMHPDGTNVVRVTNDAELDAYPTWSTDGAWIAFERYPTEGVNRGDIYLIRPDGTGLRAVTDGSLDFRQPAWPLRPYSPIP